MKTENKFYCRECRRKIEFGDEDAVKYDGEFFCSEDCVLRRIDIWEPTCTPAMVSRLN